MNLRLSWIRFAASDFLETVRKINRDIGTTVILTEHRLQDVIPWADKVYVMDKGSLLTQGTPREIGEFLKKEHHGMFFVHAGSHADLCGSRK